MRPRFLSRQPVCAWLGCIVLVVLALALTFNSLFTTPWKDLAGRWDVYRTIGPLGYYLDWSLHQGVFPMWNPLTLCGMPYAANPVAAAFYPFNLLRSLLTFAPTPLKTQIGWVVLMATHALLAAMGLILLARAHKMSYKASITAVVVFLFSAIWVRRLCEYHFITMVAWLPLMLWLVRRALSGGTLRVRAWHATACGVAFGVALLSGIANIAPYMGLTLAGYAVLYRATHWNRRLLPGDGLVFAWMCIAALIVSAAFWLPGTELAGYTSRAKDSGYELAHPAYGGTAHELFQTLVRYPGLKWEPENIRGVGVGALILVLLGLAHRRWRDGLLFGGLLLMLFDCAMGYPFPMATLVEKLSPIQLVSSTRAFDFALIPFALLAGRGVDVTADALNGRLRRTLISIVTLGAGALCLHTLINVLEQPKYFPASSLTVILPALALVTAAAIPWLPNRTRWAWVLPLFIYAETLVWTERYVPYMIVHRDFDKWAGACAGSNDFWNDNRRGTDAIPNRHLYALRAAANGYEPAHLERVRKVVAGEGRLRTYHRLVTAEEVDQDNARGLLFLKRSFWLTRQYVQGPLPDRKVPYPVTTTAFLAEAPPDMAIPRVETSVLPRSRVAEATPAVSLNVPPRPQARGGFVFPTVALPKKHCALTVHYACSIALGVKAFYKDTDSGRTESGRVVLSPAGDGLFELSLPDFDRIQVTLAPEQERSDFRPLSAVVSADQADEGGLITVVSRGPNRVRVQVRDLPDNRLLLFVDAAYPGWKAYVDGVQTPILLANDAFKAVALSAGTHEVEFVFFSWRALVGALVSGAALFGGLFGLWRLRAWRAAAA